MYYSIMLDCGMTGCCSPEIQSKAKMFSLLLHLRCPGSQAECCCLQPQLLRGWKQKENLKLDVLEQPGQGREAPTETSKHGNKCQNAVLQKVIAGTRRFAKREANTTLLQR